MNKLKNRVQLIGNLGNDPVISTTATGKTVARLSLATNDHIRNKAGDKITLTQWHNVVAWGKTAELCARYLKKGKRGRTGRQTDFQQLHRQRRHYPPPHRNCGQRADADG